MSMTDPIADLLTRLRNGLMARHKTVDVPASKMKAEIARILARLGDLDRQLRAGRNDSQIRGGHYVGRRGQTLDHDHGAECQWPGYGRGDSHWDPTQSSTGNLCRRNEENRPTTCGDRGSASAHRLQFAEMSLQQLFQFKWLGHNNRVAFDAQKLLITKFCQRA